MDRSSDESSSSSSCNLSLACSFSSFEGRTLFSGSEVNKENNSDQDTTVEPYSLELMIESDLASEPVGNNDIESSQLGNTDW